MFKHMAFSGLIGGLLLLTSSVYADQQALKVEEMLSKKHKLNFDLSVAYSNIDQKSSLTTVVPVPSLLSFIYIPTYAGDQVLDQDIIVTSLNIKYGLTDWIEAVVFAAGHNTSSRVKYGSTLTHQSDLDFDHAGVGLTFKVKDEGSTPSLLLGVTSNIISRLPYTQRAEDGTVTGTENRDETFETFNFYALSYFTVDPIVFVVRASYQWSLEKEYQSDTIDRPDVLAISPEIYFAVNPYTNLTWGLTYQYVSEQYYNGKAETNAESLVGFSVGMSYEVTRGNIISVQGMKNDSSSYGQSSITLIYSKRF